MENKEIDNLWSEDFFTFEAKKNLPFLILEKQASYFNNMAKDILVAKAVSNTINVNQTNFKFVHSLRIIAPKLDNYYFDLIKLYQNGLSPYPLDLHSPFFDKEEKAFMPPEDYYIYDDKQLLKAIKDILNHKEVKEAIQNLIVQSRGKINK